jgi:hypothetical protein
MDQLRIGTEHEVGDVQDLALLIVDPDRKGLRAGDYFQKTAHSLLAGCILHLSYKAKVEGSPETFGALEEMLAGVRQPIQTDIRSFLRHRRGMLCRWRRCRDPTCFLRASKAREPKPAHGCGILLSLEGFL